MNTAPAANGFAVKNRNGEIDVKTVSPTQRAAKINALHIHGNCSIYNSMSDQLIEALWGAFATEGGWSIVAVLIVEDLS